MEKFTPPLNQLLIGNPWQQFELESGTAIHQYVMQRLIQLTETLDNLGIGDTEPQGILGGRYGYGSNFKNQVFSMRKYYWGDCECEDHSCHDKNCPANTPNFKCGDLEINWYKYIGRGMSVNAVIDFKKAEEIFNRCEESLT